MKRIRIYIIASIIVFLSFVFMINEYTRIRTELSDLKWKYHKTELALTKQIDYYRSHLDSLPFGSPIDTLRVVSNYGWRKDPITKARSFHYGIDLLCDKGKPILATGHGVVIETTYFSNYGQCIIIKHSLGYMTLYAHLSKILVNKDDSVSKGDTIGLGGSTGRSTGNHLHYEVLNKNINPADYLIYYKDVN